MHTVTAIIPAYNEAERLPGVIAAVQSATLIREILVVDDGSSDHTAKVAAACGVRVLRLSENSGKGTALVSGALAAQGDILLFLDADLNGLTPTQVDDLARPVVSQQVDMAIGTFRGGRAATDLAQILTPNISGQRCLYREFFLSTPLVVGSRSGVEIAMTVHARACKLTTGIVMLDGVTHPMKEEKLGFLRGVLSRCRMYHDIFTTLIRYFFLSRVPGRTPVGSE
ncbi:MAG: glycosyltransferase family 2 protein [Armatimonadota bacterium]